MKTLKSRRGLELLSDRALSGLSAAEREELAQLLQAEGLDDDESLDRAAAAVDLAIGGVGPGEEPLPRELAARLEAAGRQAMSGGSALAPARASTPSSAGRSGAGAHPATLRSSSKSSTTAAGAQVVVMPLPDATTKRDWTRWTGWMAAAAAVSLVLGQSLRRSSPPAHEGEGVKLPPVAALAAPVRLLTASAGTDPRAAHATGELSWSDASGRGELRAFGLPAGAYEVWIEDAARGDRYRLAAGAFPAREGVPAAVAVGTSIPAVRPGRLLVTTPMTSADGASVVMLTVALTP